MRDQGGTQALGIDSVTPAAERAGRLHDSDFMVDWVEFDLPTFGVPWPPAAV